MHDDDDNGPPWEGRGKEFHEACNAAWNRAQGKGAKPGTYRIVEPILVECENPITAYIVKIEPTG